MRKPGFFLLLLFLLITSASTGQIPHFQNYYPLKKNQPLQVNTLYQDLKGFMWFGTEKGLFRFDGTSYKHFTTRDSLPHNEVTALAEDAEGRLWIGHANGSLSWLEFDKIHAFEPREGSPVDPISEILFDRNGVMWLSTRNDGLYYFVEDRLFRVDEEEGLPDLFIYDLFEDADGNIWAGTDAGIAVCSLQEKKISIRVIDSDDGLPDIIIKKIKVFHGETLALATEDAGMLSYNPKTHQVDKVVSSWDFGSIVDFAVKEDQLWIAAPAKGLIVYDRVTKQVRHVGSVNGASLQSTNALLLDREGNIWTGSKSGLTRTSGDAVEHIDDFGHSGGINIVALTVDHQQRIWFATNEGLFVRSTGPAGANTITQKLKSSPYSSVPVISLYTDSQGFVWAGLYGGGLLRIDPVTNEVRHFLKELRNGNVLGISGRGNTIWVATLGGSTSLQLENKNQYKITNYSSADGLSSDFIYQVFTDSQKRTWFATDGKGVSMLDERGFHHYVDGLASRVVYSIAEDIYKNIWVTAQDNGVYLFQENRFVTVPEVRLRDNSIQSLSADKHGNLIAMHNYGIDVFDVKTKKMRYWGEETGIREKQPNLNAVARDQYGQLLIGTTRGIVKFSLNNDRIMSTPQPAIDGVRVFGEPLDISEMPNLKYNENNITVQYLGFWYQNATNLNYQYKLENYDLEWLSTRNREVTFSKLPPGDYTFKVKVSDSDDFSHASETAISFSIRPPFWRTGTFYVLAIGLFLISAYGLVKFRERKLLQDKLILEAKVEERTREIQQKTEEIQAQNEEIMAQAEEIQGINENLEMLVKQRTAELEKKNKALEEYAFINAHKLRSPVASILGLVNLLAKSDQKDDTRVIREHLQHSANKLDGVVRSITKAIEKADSKYL